MRKILLTLIVLPVIVLIAGGSMFWLATDDFPTVSESAIDGLNDAESVTQLLGQLQTSIYDRKEPHTITMNKTQLRSLLAFAERAEPALRGDFSINQYQTTVNVSFQLPPNLFTRFINIETSILPGKYLHVDYVNIGSLTIRGDWAIGLATRFLDWWTKSDIASYATQQITKVEMSSDSVSVSLQPLEGFLNQLNEIQSGISSEQDQWLIDRTASYLRYLAIISVDNKAIYNNPTPSLGIYLSAVMQRARSTGKGAVERENEAALLALTVFAGHHRFANLIGAVQPDPDRAIRPPHPTVLKERKDLSQHFVISSGLKLLSEQGITTAIGEFKELMDRVMGGSGYSFVDLAADMAGVKLAQLAIDPRYAKIIQQRLAENGDEAYFFPDISDLPEGLDKAQFVAEYTDVSSDKYLAQVQMINHRIAQIPLYQDLDQKAQ